MDNQQCYDRIVKIFPILEKIEDKQTAYKIAKSWMYSFEHSKWDAIEEGCYSPMVPGKKLVDHVRVATEGVLAFAELINKYHGYSFDTQQLIVLGLMHDCCKLMEYEPDGKGGGQLSEYGKKLPHGALSAYIATEMGFDLDMIHLIITHSSHIKNKPQTIEGILFGFSDLADTQIHFYHAGLPLITEL